MSWDCKALVVLTGTWAAMAILYVTVIGMATGARAWGAGAAIFLVLMLVAAYAERRGAQVRLHAARPATAGERTERRRPTISVPVYPATVDSHPSLDT